MARHTIKSESDWRLALLTDLLPYEVPLPLSNEGFYRFLSGGAGTSSPDLVKAILTSKRMDTVPFSYRIRKNDGANRKLSLVHPAVQKELAQLYQVHSSLIISLCSRSPFSIRYPDGIARSYYEESLGTEEPEEDRQAVEAAPDAFAPQLPYRASYFTYQRYSRLHEFHSSYEFVGLEKRFRLLLEFDIASCFYTIYTHSIAWAVKDKPFAKAHKGRSSFEEDFDHLMQAANYCETNGIVVGPEASRLFAEIILQRVDLNVAGKLLQQGLQQGRDYDVRRYIDDYFVFANNSEIRESIFCTFSEELENFNLRINTSKTRRSSIPFISNQTMAKAALSQQLGNWAAALIVQLPASAQAGSVEAGADKSRRQLAFPKGLRKSAGLRAITDVKSIVQHHEVTYSEVADYALGILKNWLAAHDRRNRSEVVRLLCDKESTAESMLNSYLDVAFYLYTMDIRVKTTYKILEILLILNRFLHEASPTLMHNVQHRIYVESTRVLAKAREDESLAKVEILNLLIGMRKLEDPFRLTKQMIAETFGLQTDPMVPDRSLNYFQIVTLLYYVRDDDALSEIRLVLVESALEKLRAERKPFENAELVCLLFDMISCQYLTAVERSDFVDLAYEKLGMSKTPAEASRVSNFISSRAWFFNWETDLDLEGVLKKKALRGYS